MSQEENQPEDLKALEAALAALVPRGDRLDRDRLMFLAGQAAGSQPRAARHRWAWPAAFSAMTAAAASLLVIVAARPGPQIVERIVEVPVPAAPGSGQGGSDARSLLAGAKSGHPWPGPLAAGSPSSDETALALGPLLRLRLSELSGRLAATTDAAWLDQVLALNGVSRNAASQGPGTQEAPETPVPYGELRERLLEAPAASPAGVPPVPGILGFPGARS